MKKQIITSIGILTVCFGLMSCSELHSPHYVGELMSVSEDDLGDTSIWVVDEDVYAIKRTGSNSCIAASMSWNNKNKEYTIGQFSVVLSELDDHLFLNLQDDEGYLIVRAVCSLDESLILFTIDNSKMKKDIADGKLKARADGDHIVMECTKEEQDEYIRQNINTMFSYDCARVARKVYEKEPKKPSSKQKDET